MASDEPLYRVEADWDNYFEQLRRCPESQQERITHFVANILPLNPKATHPPLLKKLKGQYSHMWQFECGNRRLIYTVNDDTRAVLIEYFDLHPTW